MAYPSTGYGYNSHGLVQWTGDRKTHLEQFARKNGLDPKDWRTQVDFISEEMNTTERAAFEALRKNPNITPEEAARIVREQYERPDPAVANDAYRQQIAREVYDGRSVRPVQHSIQQNSLNDFAEDVKQVASEEASLNFMRDPVKDITPEELSNKLKNRETKPEFRSYDTTLYEEIRHKTLHEKIEFAIKNTKELKDGVIDPLGEKARVIFDADNETAINNVANAFVRGHKDNATISDTRTMATALIKDTIQQPEVILKQKNGRKAYVSYWKGPNDIMHKVVVSLDAADKGKIITSHVAHDTTQSTGPGKAMRQMVSDIKKADAVLYVSDSLLNKRARLSEYPRPPVSDRVSTPDTRLHPSGNSIVADETGKVKLPGDERSFMARPVEEAAGSDLTTWQGETISRKQILDDVNSISGLRSRRGVSVRKALTDGIILKRTLYEQEHSGIPELLCMNLATMWMQGLSSAIVPVLI